MPWKTTIFTGTFRLTGMTAPFVRDGAMNTTVFRAYMEQVLVPPLAPGDIVIMDNLPECRTANKVTPHFGWGHTAIEQSRSQPVRDRAP